MASALLEGRVLAGHCMKAVGCACASQRDQCNHSHGVPQKIAFCACNSPGATHCPFFWLFAFWGVGGGVGMGSGPAR